MTVDYAKNLKQEMITRIKAKIKRKNAHKGDIQLIASKLDTPYDLVKQWGTIFNLHDDISYPNEEVFRNIERYHKLGYGYEAIAHKLNFRLYDKYNKYNPNVHQQKKQQGRALIRNSRNKMCEELGITISDLKHWLRVMDLQSLSHFPDISIFKKCKELKDQGKKTKEIAKFLHVDYKPQKQHKKSLTNSTKACKNKCNKNNKCEKVNIISSQRTCLDVLLNKVSQVLGKDKETILLEAVKQYITVMSNILKGISSESKDWTVE